MASLLTIITDVPEIIGGLTSIITLAQKVLPEAETDIQNLWASVLPQVTKLKADFLAMTAGGLHLVTVVTDVPALVSDVTGLIGDLGTLISALETDASNLWAEIIPVVTSVKSQLSNLVGSAPATPAA
jgi:phage-related protein